MILYTSFQFMMEFNLGMWKYENENEEEEGGKRGYYKRK